MLPEALRIAGFGEWRLVLYAVLLIGVMLWRPSGLLGNREIAFLVPFNKQKDRRPINA